MTLTSATVAIVSNWSIKTWLGETIGIITNQSVELTGTAAEGMQKITEALLKGFRGTNHTECFKIPKWIQSDSLIT